MKRPRKLIIEIRPTCVCVTACDRGCRTCHSEDLLDATAASTITHDAQVAAALRRALDALGTRLRAAVLVLDGASSFSKRIVLPPVRPAHLQRALQCEASEHIPFSLEEVVWDAQLFETHPPEAILVAARKEVVDGLARAVSANGLKIERVITTTVALANAVAAQCGSGSAPSVLVAGTDGPVEMVGYDGTRFLMRSMPPGAGLEAIGREVDRLVEKLGHAAGSVQRLLPNDKTLSVAAGAMLDGPVCVDLSPETTRQKQVARRRLLPRSACVALVIAILGVWIGGLQSWARADDRKRARLSEHVKSLRMIEQHMVPIEAEIARTRRAANACVQAMERAARWHTVFKKIQSVLPEGMYLLSSESMTGESGARGIRIEILSYTDREPEGTDPVKALRDALRAQPLFRSETRVSSRPSRGAFARVFTLDVMIEEDAL